MANKVSKKEKKELDELEDELVFLSSKKKELEQSLLVLKSENDSKEESLESKLKDDYSSSIKSINEELASLTSQEEALMESFSKLLDERFTYRLALSATLERHRDEEGTAFLYSFFGERG